MSLTQTSTSRATRGYMDVPGVGAFEEPNWTSPENADPWGLASTARWLDAQASRWSAIRTTPTCEAGRRSHAAGVAARARMPRCGVRFAAGYHSGGSMPVVAAPPGG